ncbi:jg7086 [Pararge aegeria aegeria]|uniref:Jg7086 protein n=1 Tax=Pararge aegeria aegeria TaxID=348720 RepID=A0A8S4R2M1_9NEOP|nr:jg7086 [Pararge aegeria aegeria]
MRTLHEKCVQGGIFRSVITITNISIACRGSDRRHPWRLGDASGTPNDPAGDRPALHAGLAGHRTVHQRRHDLRHLILWRDACLLHHHDHAGMVLFFSPGRDNIVSFPTALSIPQPLAYKWKSSSSFSTLWSLIMQSKMVAG